MKKYKEIAIGITNTIKNKIMDIPKLKNNCSKEKRTADVIWTAATIHKIDSLISRANKLNYEQRAKIMNKINIVLGIQQGAYLINYISNKTMKT
jgi:hypothetical protein